MRVVTALFFMVSTWTAASACSCAPPPAELKTYRGLAEWSVSKTPVIFEGTVENIKVPGWPIKPVAGETVPVVPRLRVTFSAVHLYRGLTPPEVVVETGLGGGDCGFAFAPGAAYLVFAWKGEGEDLSTGICTGTTLLEHAGTVLRLLHGEPPTSEDLVDWRRSAEDRVSPSRASTHQVCGKISPPIGKRMTSVEVIFWRVGQEETAAFQYWTADAEQDGTYCIDYLSPGKYVIGAIELGKTGSGLRHLSYYPGVLERSEANAVEIQASGKTVRADFPLLQQPLYKVHGYLRGAPENPAQPILVMLLSSITDKFHLCEPVELGPNGFFEFVVPSGRYTAFALSQIDGKSLTFLSSGVEVEVAENVDGLKLDYVAKK
jgi:hypothetical protein